MPWLQENVGSFRQRSWGSTEPKLCGINVWCSSLLCPLKSSNMKTAIYKISVHLFVWQTTFFYTEANLRLFSQIHTISSMCHNALDSVPQGLRPGARCFDHPFMPIDSTKKHPRTRKECEECSWVVALWYQNSHTYEPIQQILPAPLPHFEPRARYFFNANLGNPSEFTWFSRSNPPPLRLNNHQSNHFKF